MRALSLTVVCLLLVLAACSDRARRNPLDPRAGDQVVEVAGELAALAGDGYVSVNWDYRYFEDVAGYVLYRRQAGDAYVCLTEPPLDRTATAFRDLDVDNGQGYEYRLGLLIAGEGERQLEHTAAATPGPEVVWAADRGSGLVWKVAPDGRNAAFAKGRFGAVEGIDVDPLDGTCWVADGYSAAIYAVTPAGELTRWEVDVGALGPLRTDAQTRRVWLIDRGRREVCWFDPPPAGQPPRLTAVDARFAAPSLLAPQAGGCWIGDTEAGRILHLAPDGQRREFTELPDLRALAPAPAATAWVLLDGGFRLVRVGPAAQERGEFIDLDFQAADLAVDASTGRLFAAGGSQVVLLAASGAVLDRWEAPAGAANVVLDAWHQTVWVAGTNRLWKLNLAGEQLADLRGFVGLVRVALVPQPTPAAR